MLIIMKSTINCENKRYMFAQEMQTKGISVQGHLSIQQTTANDTKSIITKRQTFLQKQPTEFPRANK